VRSVTLLAVKSGLERYVGLTLRRLTEASQSARRLLFASGDAALCLELMYI
jgi:hypothetical protein